MFFKDESRTCPGLIPLNFFFLIFFLLNLKTIFCNIFRNVFFKIIFITLQHISPSI